MSKGSRKFGEFKETKVLNLVNLFLAIQYGCWMLLAITSS